MTKALEILEFIEKWLTITVFIAAHIMPLFVFKGGALLLYILILIPLVTGYALICQCMELVGCES